MKKAYFVLVAFFCNLALAPSSAADETVYLPRVTLSGEGLVLPEWCRLGPFTSGFGERALDKDFLKSVGTSEAGLVASQLQKLCARAGVLSTSVVKAQGEEGWVNLYDLYDGEREERKGAPQTAVYLGAEILSSSDTSSWMLLRRYGDTKVWLNGELLHICKERCSKDEYGQSIRLTLKTGVNLLFVKLGNVNRGVSFGARLEPTMASAAREALRRADTVVKRPVVKPGEALELDLSAAPSPTQFIAEIKTSEGTPVRKVIVAPRASINAKGLPPGLYQLSVSGYGQRVEDGFYIGSVEMELAKLQARTKAAVANVEERSAIHLETLIGWVRAASKPWQREPDQPPMTAQETERMQIYTEQRTVDAMLELVDALNLVGAGAEAFQNRPGVHLRGFRSRIDDQIQHYQLFVPQSYRAEDAGLPLLVIPVTPFIKQVPYLESYFVHTRKGAKYWTKAAETLGLGILWPGYRMAPYGNPLDLVHVDEALAAVSRDYKINTSQLYLSGGCGSGLTVSMQAVRHPGRYAAIMYQHPVLHRVKNRYDENPAYATYPAYQAWLRETDPVAALAALPNLSIWILHDSDDPLSGPLSHSVDLVQLARAAGGHPIFERILPRDRVYDVTFNEKQMAWLMQHRSPSPAILEIPKEPPTGPLARVFAERFIVVKSTHGTPDEKQAAERWHKHFCDEWRRTNYGPCRAVDDDALQVTEEVESNLVLVGNPRTNSVWARWADRLPVSLLPRAITVKGEEWAGDSQAIQAWVPHPEIPQRKIALIGADNLKRAQVGTMELWVDGWFDFAIWSNNQAGKPVLQHADRYATGPMERVHALSRRGHPAVDP